ncbi:hypothetical protein [Streptomyces sp. NPDC047981]|uniref:hypothetical protein n=1 Tax=Streptomyces sp. NPDC047981 TaxID=3154610 RepID=UPI003435DF5D
MSGGVGAVPGRELSSGVVLLAQVTAVVSLTVGALLAVASAAGYAAGAWTSPEAVSPGLVGAAMAGVAPALFTVGRARVWEEARTLVWPLVIVLVGLFAVSLVNGDALWVARGGSLFLVLFSLGWVVTLGALAAAAVLCLVLQYRRPSVRPPERVAPERLAALPGWSKPALAVLGSGWAGIGAGLLAVPGFWSGFVPWQVNRADAQGLGVWALALGVGVLGALAEDDLARLRPALLAVPSVALAAGAVLAVHAPDVRWASGPGLSLAALLLGLLVTGVTGRWLWARAVRAAGSAREG